MKILKLMLMIGLISLVTFGGGWSPVWAQEEPQQEVTNDDVNRVAKQLFCPTCESTPVDVCPTQACSDWRALIRQKLEAGESEEEILQYFADTYGPQALAEPPRAGFGWVAWFAPIVVVVAGVLWFGRYLLKLQAAGGQQANLSASPAGSNSSETDEYLRQIEQEL